MALHFPYTLNVSPGCFHRHVFQPDCAQHAAQVYTWSWGRNRRPSSCALHYVSGYLRLTRNIFVMAIQQRKQSKTSILLTFKVLQFVNQIRRRIKPRILDGSTRPCQLGNDSLHPRTLDSVLRGPSWISRHSISLSHHDRRRVCKSRDNYARRLKPSPKLRASASDVSVSSDISGGQVQQYV